MLTIEIVFPAGRFHATPWRRNVNEGIPEWPPAPYRILRALYDAWKRKRPGWPVASVEPILAALASSLPRFVLPPAAAAHTRAFLSENDEDVAKRQKIFDAFVALNPGDAVLVHWADVTLCDSQRRDLDELLAQINYLGRSESWVAARVRAGAPSARFNCHPIEAESGEKTGEIVRVACPIAREAYMARPFERPAARKGARPVTVPWLEALGWTTRDLTASRRSEPPGLKYVDYVRPRHCFDVAPRPRPLQPGPTVHGVLYALVSKVSAPVTATVEIAERFRRKLMGIHRAIVGDPARVSQRFSGKSEDGKPLSGHRHVYILPLDRDGDGRLDHLIVACRASLDRTEQLALDRARSLWQPDGRPDLQLVPLRWGTCADLFPPARRLASATPFVPPRHHRKGRGSLAEWLVTEVRREAVHHGLPVPSQVTPVPRLRTHLGRQIRWLEFRRSRKGEQPRMGYGFELEFAEPVTGPIALGYGCHFGLGQFVPVEVSQ